MKTLFALMALTLSSLALAATDPCKLLAPGEVKSGLGAPEVTAAPATDQDVPTCEFDFEDGVLTVSVTPGIQKLLGGKTLLEMLQSGGRGGTPIQGATVIPGLGDEAVGVGGSSTTEGVPQDLVMLYLRKGDVLLGLFAVDSNHSASKVNLQSVTLLAKRALLRWR